MRRYIRRMNKIVSIFCGFLCLNWSIAQNLIPDSSFEVNKFLPTDFSAINASNSWSRPSGGTSDLFCKCSKADKHRLQKAYSFVDVPQNAMGFQLPHSGTCYAGFFALSHGDYREYLQTPLTKPLQKDKTYQLTMYLSLADYSRASIDQIGLCFLSAKNSYTSSDVITNLDPVYADIQTLPGNNTEDWVPVTFTYQAKGGEAFLLIGSFEINSVKETGFVAPKEMRTRINQNESRDAYYYLDDVSLFEVDKKEEAEEEGQRSIDPLEAAVSDIPANEVVVMKNVLFQTGKSILLPSSYPELNALAAFLVENPAIHIEIFGHTDNSGTEDTNRELSQARAETVASHLKFRGVSRSRMRAQGFGSSRPIADNATEEGRQMNRRVEFKIFEP